jgi:NAD-dependent deacetylase
METKNKINQLKEIIQNTNNIVALTGAGISTESGIPDFRSVNTGIYNKDTDLPYHPAEILHRKFLSLHPREFFEYYKKRFLSFEGILPNEGHKGLVKLENDGKLKAIITQNIDNLHQVAGSKNVLEIHGTWLKCYCMACQEKYNIDILLNSEKDITRCNCGGIIRPSVVLYGEALDDDIYNDCIKYISEAEILLVLGTSLVVYPAADLLSYFKGKCLVIINRDRTPYNNKANIIINDMNIGEVMKEIT